MTHKQMKKYAQEIYECDLIHDNQSSTQEEKTRAANRIMQISRQIMCLKDGLTIMLEIDSMVQSLMEKKNN